MKNGRIVFPATLLTDEPYRDTSCHVVIDTNCNRFVFLVRETDGCPVVYYHLEFEEPVLQKYPKLSEGRVTQAYMTEIVRPKNFKEPEHRVHTQLVSHEYGDFVFFSTGDRKFFFTMNPDPLLLMISECANRLMISAKELKEVPNEKIHSIPLEISEKLLTLEKRNQSCSPRVRLRSARRVLPMLLDIDRIAGGVVDARFEDLDSNFANDFNFLDHIN